MKKLIPNFFTFSNLFLGVLGISVLINMNAEQVRSGGLHTTSILIFIAAICDFLDGFCAKLLNAQSKIGKDLDSFADFITFGVLPSFILFKLLEIKKHDFFALDDEYLLYLGSFTPLIMPCFTAYRLARFNTVVTNSKDFIGLSSTMNGIFIATIPLIQKCSKHLCLQNIILQPEILILITITLCILMVCNLKFFSLKLDSLRWADNRVLFSIIFLSICAIVFFKLEGLFLSFCIYIFGSIFSNIYRSK